MHIPNIKKAEIVYSDSELSDEEYNQHDFEKDTLQHLKEILNCGSAPVIVYLPTERVMRQLILRNLK